MISCLCTMFAYDSDHTEILKMKLPVLYTCDFLMKFPYILLVCVCCYDINRDVML